MNKIKDARQAAGITQQVMSDLFEIPKRTIEAWETGERKPPKYVEKLIVEKLERMAAEKKETAEEKLRKAIDAVVDEQNKELRSNIAKHAQQMKKRYESEK